MTKLQSIKRFASKTEGMNFTEIFEDSQCKQVEVSTETYTVRVSGYEGTSNVELALFVNGELVFKNLATSQKDVIHYLENHVENVVQERLQVKELQSEMETAEDFLYTALDRFNGFEITAEECLSLIHEALKLAKTNEEREIIKGYAIMFSNRIAKAEIK